MVCVEPLSPRSSKASLLTMAAVLRCAPAVLTGRRRRRRCHHRRLHRRPHIHHHRHDHCFCFYRCRIFVACCSPPLTLFLLPLPASPLPLLSANAIATVAASETTTALIPSAAVDAAAGFFCRCHYFLSDFTAHRQRIRCADTRSVSATAAPLPLSPMPLPTLFPPRQPPLPNFSNLQVSRRQGR